LLEAFMTGGKMNSAFARLALALTILGFFGCGPESEEARLKPALESITAEDLSGDTKILASDEFEGRAPASPGETKTINFLRDEFEKLGVQPGNGASFFQEIPMVVSTPDASSGLHIKGGKKPIDLTSDEEFVAFTLRVAEEVTLADSEVIFAGYGIIAPEYDWNDYQGLDEPVA
jgi:hypothetical protein